MITWKTKEQGSIRRVHLINGAHTMKQVRYRTSASAPEIEPANSVAKISFDPSLELAGGGGGIAHFYYRLGN